MEARFVQKSVMLSQVVIISYLHNAFMKINYKSAIFQFDSVSV